MRYNIDSITNTIINGDTLETLKKFPDDSIDCVVTSPPYWALRDYEIDGQLGLEPTFKEYLDKLITIFAEVKRVLKKGGSVWVNLGDTYGGTGSKGNYKDPKYKDGRNGQSTALNNKMPSKCLLQIPSRFAIRMTDELGYTLRNEIIWHKPSCMPSSVKDRFTVDFEKIFFFTKNRKYYFEQQFEPNKSKPHGGQLGSRSKDVNVQYAIGDKNRYYKEVGRNKRTTWSISTKPFKGAHFAVFPPELPANCIKAGCPKAGIVLDPFMGSGTTAIVAKELGRNYIGIELNPDYVRMANERLRNTQKPLV